MAAGIHDQKFARELYRLKWPEHVDAEIERWRKYVRGKW